MSDRLLDRALSRLDGEGLDFGDVRSVNRRTEWITARSARIDNHQQTDEQGYCVRAVVDGVWGSAAGVVSGERAMDALVERAVDNARQRVARGAKPRSLYPRTTEGGQWQTPVAKDPFAIDLDEKYGLLLSANERMAQAESRVIATESQLVTQRNATRVRATDGLSFDQVQTCCGGGIQAIARGDDGRTQSRSYPKSHEGEILQGGWEVVEGLDLLGHCDRVGVEAGLLTAAPPMPEQTATIILHGSQLSLQVHESVGHPLELDRVLGDEISLAGGSWAQRDKLGTRYGSEIVNLVSDPTRSGALGSFGWDDDGTPSHRSDLVRDGVLVGYLSGWQSAGRAGYEPAGTARSDGWAGYPIDRMANVDLEPGTAGSLADLIADTESGFLLSNNRSWSIDQLRLNFQFGCEVAWEIKDGRLGTMYRDPLYVGRTPEFWGSCDAICGPEAWHSWGWYFCGKGDPMQLAHVGHGVAPARFRNVQVRSAS